MTSSDTASMFKLGLFEKLLRYIPGMILTSVVAWLGLVSSDWLGTKLLGFEHSPISGIMMAIIFGLIIGNTTTLPGWIQFGVAFSLQRLLKLGIILLGIRLSLGAIVEVGIVGLPVIALCLISGLLVARWLSARLGLSDRLGTLIAIGTSICGATAIVAAGPTIEAKEEEITYAIANITVFGILAMFFYPFFAHMVFMDNDLSAGLFLGTSIHETAQVAGSGLIYSQLFENEAVLNIATITKLVRNVFMVGIIPLMAYHYQRRRNQAEEKATNIRRLFPVFILGFLLMALIRTLGDTSLDQTGRAFWLMDGMSWDRLIVGTKQSAELFLAIAMAGVGLSTSLRRLHNLGIKPFYVGFASALIVAIVSLSALALLNFFGVT